MIYKRTSIRICFAVLIALQCNLFLLTPALAASGETDSPVLTDSPRDEKSAPAQKLGSSWSGTADLIGTLNPLGLMLTSGIDYQNSYRYSSDYDMVSAYWKTGGELGLTPAYLQPSNHFEWMPWVAAVVNVEYDGYYFFGANEGLLSFSSAQQPFGDDVRRARRGTEESGFGQRLMLQPTLQFKIDKIIVRNQSDYAWYRFPGKGPYFLELEYDTLLKNGDHLFANRTQILDEISRSGENSTLAGPFFEIVHASAANLTSRRIGLLFYSEQGPQLSFFKKSHYFGQVGYYLTDPSRSHGIFCLIGVGGDFGMK
jgi:hypothetical protein